MPIEISDELIAALRAADFAAVVTSSEQAERLLREAKALAGNLNIFMMSLSEHNEWHLKQPA